MLDKLKIPQGVKDCLIDLQTQYQLILGDNIKTFAVHGSIAMKCFKPDSSDIDVLVIVHEPLALVEKQKLGKAHVALVDEHKQRIEISVVLAQYLEEFEYPTPFEFHYGDDHLAAFADGSVDLTTLRKDPDLAAHFTITKHFGITLHGDDAQETFPHVPKKDYFDSIARDAKDNYDNVMTGADTGQCRVPKYAVLNFCRVLAYAQDEQITSKESGAQWALGNIPTEHHEVVQQALNEYQELGSSQPVDCAALKAFAEYAFGIIKGHWA